MAVVEFESSEDAASALTRDQKPFDGNTIDVELDSGSIVWVTNFPPEADETYIRDLFSKVGAIVLLATCTEEMLMASTVWRDH